MDILKFNSITHYINYFIKLFQSIFCIKCVHIIIILFHYMVYHHLNKLDMIDYLKVIYRVLY